MGTGKEIFLPAILYSIFEKKYAIMALIIER
jgi:hypothetical protein